MLIHPGFRTRLAGTSFVFAAIPLLLLVVVPARAEKWKMQYFYDKDNSAISFSDIQCPSAQRCIVAGILQEGKHNKGVVLLTGNGGARWDTVEVKEHPLSLFFLNETVGWMVTDEGIWRSADSGRTWKRLLEHKGLLRTMFLNEQHGWALGVPKLVLETQDGGATWKPLETASAPATSAETTGYYWISFDAQKEHGVIVGASNPPRPHLPDWMDPERARLRRTPSTSILLETMDGGKTWNNAATKRLGELTRVRFGKSYALGLYQLPSSAASASEITMFDTTDKPKPVSLPADRSVRDLAIIDGQVFAAAIELPGKSHELPIPGKVKMMQTGSLQTWIDMDIDYRAVASELTLAAVDAHNAWVVTDTGMILKLTE